ncbi:MAG: hypothetical protein CL607_17140 [Anaerolineaceae bacterium]|nr:hypothetical protein [Anaerolineaceae bacterium]
MKLNLIMLVLLSALSFATTKTYAQDETLIVDNSSQTLTADNISQMSLIHQFGEHTRGVAFNPDGTLLAIASQVSDNDYHIEIVDVQSGELLGHIGGRMDFIRDIIWSPDSLRIATISGRRTGGGTEERSVKVYTLASARDLNYYQLGHADVWYADYVEPQDSPGNPVQIAWHPTNIMLAATFHNQLVILDPNQDKVLFSTEIPSIEDVYWMSDGNQLLALSSESLPTIWGVPPE